MFVSKYLSTKQVEKLNKKGGLKYEYENCGLEIPFHQIGGEIMEKITVKNKKFELGLEIPFHQIGGEMSYK